MVMRGRIGRIAVAAVVVWGVLAIASGHARLITITHGGTTINMDFTDIGNAGNDPDTTGDPDPAGAVAYDYAIGTYEVSENQWDAVVAASAGDDLDDPGRWSGDQPVAQISWHDAAMFCNWMTSGDVTQGSYTINAGTVTGIDRVAAMDAYGKVYVIPTEDEWYKVAYYEPTGGLYYNYPTGSDTAPIDVLGGTAPGTAVYGGSNVTPTAPADVDNSGGSSPYGTMAQGGNVWEWNETLIGGNRGLRGESYYDLVSFRMSATYRHSLDPTSEYDWVGFRVALINIPEPGSVLLLIVGLAGMARGRRV